MVYCNKLNITLVSFVTHLLLNEMHFPAIDLSSHDSGVSYQKLGCETCTATSVKSASNRKKKLRSLIVSHCFKTKHCSKKRKQLHISVICWWCRQMAGIRQHVIDSWLDLDCDWSKSNLIWFTTFMMTVDVHDSSVNRYYSQTSIFICDYCWFCDVATHTHIQVIYFLFYYSFLRKLLTVLDDF